MRRPRKRKKRARSGARLFFLALLIAGLVCGGPSSPGTYALVSGTVFRETGLSLAGAEVTLTQNSVPEKGKKPRAMKAVSDSRGEFAFRVAPGKAVYTVAVRAAGYQKAEKEVTVTADERVDVFFEMRPESK
jgi:hypothetical protein